MVTFLLPDWVVPTEYSGGTFAGGVNPEALLDLELLDNFEQLFDRAVRLCQLAVELCVLLLQLNDLLFQADLGGGIGGFGSLAGFCRSGLGCSVSHSEYPVVCRGEVFRGSPQMLKHTVVRSQ